MESIRKLREFDRPKKQSITKSGKVRKEYVRKAPSKKWSINVSLTEEQKVYLETEAFKNNVKPTEIVRKILTKEIDTLAAS